MQRVSVVIPVYRGETTLTGAVEGILRYRAESATPHGVPFRVDEIVLVFDNGPDDSERVMRDLEREHAEVSCVWLTRNYGQHAATIAGMASTSGDWVATVDEDGEQDPADLGTLLDRALETRADVVYGEAVNPAPHGWLRNLASVSAKRLIAALSGDPRARQFNSYRLIDGEIARVVAAYAGPGVYLDISLGWIARSATTAPVTLRHASRPSGYSLRSLGSHFWRLMVSSGTRPLRFVSVAGVALALAGVGVAAWIIAVKVALGFDVEGWASLAVISLLGFGAVLFSLGIVAEYVGANLKMAMGRPLYVVRESPRRPPVDPAA